MWAHETENLETNKQVLFSLHRASLPSCNKTKKENVKNEHQTYKRKQDVQHSGEIAIDLPYTVYTSAVLCVDFQKTY